VAPQDWHTPQTGAVLVRLDSTPDGLTSVAAQQRLLSHGPNTIPGKKRRSLPLMLLAQFSDFMIVVLLAAALLSGFIGEPQDTIAILVIVLLNAIIGAGE
jgi:Ca2+-transporting ATPase